MKKKVFSLLLAGMLTFSMGTTAYATEDAIADMQAQKQQAEAGLAQTQANIDSLQSKKQELENYLSDLNTQYEDLTNAISELSIQAGEKENELKQLHTELKKAKKALNKQYDDMKLRIQYMYENGGTSALETLLSSKDLSEFLNNAESGENSLFAIHTAENVASNLIPDITIELPTSLIAQDVDLATAEGVVLKYKERELKKGTLKVKFDKFKKNVTIFVEAEEGGDEVRCEYTGAFGRIYLVENSIKVSVPEQAVAHSKVASAFCVQPKATGEPTNFAFADVAATAPAISIVPL
jgi:hypothetical protein